MAPSPPLLNLLPLPSFTGEGVAAQGSTVLLGPWNGSVGRGKGRPRTLSRCLVCLLATLTLSACGSILVGGTQEAAGIAGAGVASAITKSATIATGIGLGVAAGANAGLQYAERKVHGHEQDRIAEAAGAIAPGGVGPWNVEHDFPIEDDEHGEVAVIRTVGSKAIECKEIVFSVDTVADHRPQRSFYTATVCHDGPRWKWASAEPATERWGSLQ